MTDFYPIMPMTQYDREQFQIEMRVKYFIDSLVDYAENRYAMLSESWADCPSGNSAGLIIARIPETFGDNWDTHKFGIESKFREYATAHIEYLHCVSGMSKKYNSEDYGFYHYLSRKAGKALMKMMRIQELISKL